MDGNNYSLFVIHYSLEKSAQRIFLDFRQKDVIIA